MLFFFKGCFNANQEENDSSRRVKIPCDPNAPQETLHRSPCQRQSPQNKPPTSDPGRHQSSQEQPPENCPACHSASQTEDSQEKLHCQWAEKGRGPGEAERRCRCCEANALRQIRQRNKGTANKPVVSLFMLRLCV